MTGKILSKEKLANFLLSLSEKYELWVPLLHDGGDIFFDNLDSLSQAELNERVVLDNRRTAQPPKAIFFPQSEIMFEFEGKRVRPVEKHSPKVVFGIKPCDLRGIFFTDDFFRRNFTDTYYLARRKDTIFVVAGCSEPPSRCFCAQLGTGPFLKEGFDLQLVDIGDRFLVEGGSGAGEMLFNEAREYFREAAEEDFESAQAVKVKAEKAVRRDFDIRAAMEVFEDGKDDTFRPLYSDFSRRCISCGGCLYVCPTCTCFNVYDRSKGTRGRRVRNWDTCIFSGYTREASGYNPRAEKELRTARRYEHKLKYDPLIAGLSGCVGCGRCKEACPVNIGIEDLAIFLAEKGKKNAGQG